MDEQHNADQPVSFVVLLFGETSGRNGPEMAHSCLAWARHELADELMIKRGEASTEPLVKLRAMYDQFLWQDGFVPYEEIHGD